jgi:hypothetical protein
VINYGLFIEGMKERNTSDDPQQSLGCKATPREEAVIFGVAAISEGGLVAGACHSFMHERPEGWVQILGASLIALGMMYRANQLVRKINTLESQMIVPAQRNEDLIKKL